MRGLYNILNNTIINRIICENLNINDILNLKLSSKDFNKLDYEIYDLKIDILNDGYIFPTNIFTNLKFIKSILLKSIVDLYEIDISKISNYLHELKNINYCKFISLMFKGNINEIDIMNIYSVKKIEFIKCYFFYHKFKIILNKNIKEIILKNCGIEKIEIYSNEIFINRIFYKEEVHNNIKESVNIEFLNLTQNSIIEFPPSFISLKYLMILDMSRNKIKTIPDHICELKNLKELDLSHNRISSISNKIGELPNLTILKLHDNVIEHLPHEIVNLNNLLLLSLNCNMLKSNSLHLHFNKLTNLKYLFLQNNIIDYIPSVLYYLENLIHLNLEYNLIEYVSDEIINLKNIEILNLSFNYLESIPDFTQLLKLKHLYLYNYNYENIILDELINDDVIVYK